MKRILLLLGVISVFLLAGCSQDVSSADDDELSEEDVIDARLSSVENSSSSAESSSERSVSGDKSSSSGVLSSSEGFSSSGVLSSSGTNSSSSVNSSNSVKSSTSAEASSSSVKKVQPKLDDYPYYDYVAVPWSIGPRKSTPRYYDADAFDSLKYTLVDTNEFRDDFTWNARIESGR